MEESFEEMCIRTGYKPHGAQGINGARYYYDLNGSVKKRQAPCKCMTTERCPAHSIGF